jgi:hypothetical protein
MMHISNLTRAGRAQAVLQSYVEAEGEVFENSGSEIADLIADLLHLAVWQGEFAEEPEERIIGLARLHFEAEQADPEET